jgi:hypothetical protein
MRPPRRTAGRRAVIQRPRVVGGPVHSPTHDQPGRMSMQRGPRDERPVMPLLVRAWDMIIELVSTALRAPPPADCWPHRPSGQSRLAGVRAPTIGGGSQSVITAAGGEAREPAAMRVRSRATTPPMIGADVGNMCRIPAPREAQPFKPERLWQEASLFYVAGVSRGCRAAGVSGGSLLGCRPSRGRRAQEARDQRRLHRDVPAIRPPGRRPR